MIDAQRDFRVLTVAPTPKDSRITVDILEHAGCNVTALQNIDDLCAGIRTGAGAVLLTDDSLGTREAIKNLASVLGEQPPWSDMPIVLASREGTESPLMFAILPSLRNVLILKQPVHIPTLISVVKSALRSRNRQYEIRDLIEERKKSEEILARAKSELEQRVKERTAEIARRADQLRALAAELTLAEQRERKRLALVLHDGLQQMLVAAKFKLALLQRGDDVQTATADISNLIDDCIQTSRSLTAELNPPILHSDGLLAALEWLVQWMDDKHGLSVELTSQGRITAAPEVISVLLFQSVRELLFNVAKHAGTRRARVAVSRLDRHIQVEVSDEGVGFDPEKLVRSEIDAGSGMGLFSIRERLGYLGGTMSIDTAPERGSRFVLTAPLIEPSKEIPDTSTVIKSVAFTHSPEKGANDSARISVVLVDDHLVMRQGLASLLSVEPDIAIIGEASDGRSAVDLIRNTRPAVVLMDISMPGMDGIEATRSIHEQMPDVKIIGLSMLKEGGQVAAILEAGAVAYLAKTGPSKAVIEAIRKCVRKP